jgi:hypothetical protein
MQYNIKKRKQITDRFEKIKYIDDYHKWLKEERIKDKKEVPYVKVETGNTYLRRNLCPYCKKELKIEKQKKVIHKICEKHGLLQVMKN